ncbi:response regulator [Candidatus Nitrospira bockiana]
MNDDPVLLAALRETLHLRLHPSRIDTASSAIEALSLLERLPYDLVLCDIRMPGETGIDLLQQVKQMKPEQRVILFTGDVREAFAEEGLKKGADGVLRKPLDRDELVRVAKRVLGQTKARP